MTRRHVSKRHLQKKYFLDYVYLLSANHLKHNSVTRWVYYLFNVCSFAQQWKIIQLQLLATCKLRTFIVLPHWARLYQQIWSHWVLCTIREFLRSIRCRTESLFYCCSIVSNSSLGQWWWSSGQRARHLLRRSEFESCWSIQFYSVNCFKRTKINKKRPGIAHF